MWSRLRQAVQPALLGAARRALDTIAGRRAATRTSPPSHRSRRVPSPARSTSAYPGDYTGPLVPQYAPIDDALPDPGEVVWAWVPFEEDHARGKDRPVLVVGRDGPWLLVLPLTSKDHDRDAAQEARAGRHWVDVGTGAWDPRGRPSEARVDRVVRIDPGRVRRIGARLDRPAFDRVARAATR